ncbi:AbrB/MazE/SpoVT family DNA-binding domain-containing protein [Schaalia sp. 19OD2882]|uniref:AbrB/MazE/SpoVT family DNA-binding domain-containing protein n=1 Tax=Schaalia sp. 19OD2882 TaxID=2794089 RepID=UPI001C1EC2E9|nr:AbrB/MazE/SpoVT family DNA-binding domain-containing protein [Schaalia sp. 19OD2882]QWW19687.1 AbrB/MazE/SpoVT family DNA-binding domain-containing protein [Schaalia sp. 19OD2882]
MNTGDGKYAWMVKIGERGQFVIPKEARDLFGLQPGTEILVLGDAERGLAILPRAAQGDFIAHIFSAVDQSEGGEQR